MKVCVLLWDERGRDRAANRDAVLGLADTLVAHGAYRLLLDVVDPESDVPSPSPFGRGEHLPCALLNAWSKDPKALLPVLTEAGYRVAAYRVDPSVYTDYGDNAHHAPRDWPDRTRSPGIVTVNLVVRPKKLDKDTWVARWHGVMSPVSERIQPRARYVRNLVLEALTDDAPPWDGIVEECWPTVADLTQPMRFYGAGKNPLRMAWNMWAIVRAVMGFTTMSKVRTMPMGEYFWKS